MTRQIVWTPPALRNLRKQMSHIAIESPKNAEAVTKRLEAAVQHLAEFPTGRPGRRAKTFEKYVPKTAHVLVYSKSETTVEILRVIHASRDSKPGEWPQD